jgi:hypothetical protein
MQWAFSVKIQDDYDTALLDADVSDSHPVREANVANLTKELRSTKDTYGKGHEFSTDTWEVSRSTDLARSMDGSSMVLGWACSLVLGKVTTAQPDAVGSPNTYYHDIELFDPPTAGTSVLPTTTIIEKVSTGIKRQLPSMAMRSVTITGEGFETLNVAVEMIGSGVVNTSTKTMPALSTVSYLASNKATVKLGDSQENLSTRVRSWSVAFNNDPKEDRGYFPTSDLYRGRLEIGSRSVIPSLVIDLDATSDAYTDFLNNTELALDIYAEGDYTEGTDYRHYLRIRFPNLYYRAIPIEENDGVWTYSVSFDEETVIYDSTEANPLVRVEVQNLESEYLGTAST